MYVWNISEKESLQVSIVYYSDSGIQMNMMTKISSFYESANETSRYDFYLQIDDMTGDSDVVRRHSWKVNWINWIH